MEHLVAEVVQFVDATATETLEEIVRILRDGGDVAEQVESWLVRRQNLSVGDDVIFNEELWSAEERHERGYTIRGKHVSALCVTPWRS